MKKKNTLLKKVEQLLNRSLKEYAIIYHSPADDLWNVAIKTGAAYKVMYGGKNYAEAITTAESFNHDKTGIIR